MKIEVECKGCGTLYRVREDLAGRVAECKHCGQKFRVPYRSPVVKLSDEEIVEASPPTPHDVDEPFDSTPNSLPLKHFEPAAVTTRDSIKGPLLPVIISELWLPLGVCVIGYGIALALVIRWALHSPGAVAGIILIAVAMIMLLVLVTPMTIRALEGASKTLEFELPNAVWLQAVAAFTAPTLGLTIGLITGGITEMFVGGAIGLLIVAPLMTLMYGTSVLKAVQATVIAALLYVMSLAGTALVLGALIWIMPLWHLTLPWKQRETTVASASSVAPPPTVEEPVLTPSSAETQQEPTTTSPTQVAEAKSIFSDSPSPTPVAPAPLTPQLPVAPQWRSAVDTAAAPIKMADRPALPP